jgi:hypothetical protein
VAASDFAPSDSRRHMNPWLDLDTSDQQRAGHFPSVGRTNGFNLCLHGAYVSVWLTTSCVPNHAKLNDQMNISPIPPHSSPSSSIFRKITGASEQLGIKFNITNITPVVEDSSIHTSQCVQPKRFPYVKPNGKLHILLQANFPSNVRTGGFTHLVAHPHSEHSQPSLSETELSPQPDASSRDKASLYDTLGSRIQVTGRECEAFKPHITNSRVDVLQKHKRACTRINTWKIGFCYKLQHNTYATK